MPIKKAATKVPATPASKKAAAPAPPSLDSIARAAYLNYRRRVDEGLPGDSNDDWLTAVRQLEGDKPPA